MISSLVLCRRARSVALACISLLSFIHLPAKADLWSYVDEHGITHLASEQVDDRYTLFFKGADFSNLNPKADGFASAKGDARVSSKVKGTAKNDEPAFVVPKRFAALDATKSYQSVQKHMAAAAKQHAVDIELLKAVIAAESGFDPTAVSPKGAVGLMQLMPTTAERYGVAADKADRKDKKGKVLPAQTIEQKLTDPQTNIHAGARYLAYLIKFFKGDLTLAVAAYNAGEGAVQRAGNKVPNYKETQGYVKTVMGLYGAFKPPTLVASSGAQPVATAAGKVNSRRVRVEFAGSLRGANRTGATADARSTVAEQPALLPVVYKPTAQAPVDTVALGAAKSAE